VLLVRLNLYLILLNQKCLEVNLKVASGKQVKLKQIMTYNEIKPILKEGYIASLPKFEGYFKWDYNTNDI
jgi:hypothetical protein